MYRVIALDLDGTLLRSDKTVSDRTFSVLKECQKQGMRIVLATARPPRAISRLLPPFFNKTDWICYNGAEIYEKGKRLLQYPLDPALACRVLAVLDELVPDALISVEVDDHLYANRPINYPLDHTVGDLRQAVLRPAAKILVDGTAIEDTAAFRASLPEGTSVVFTSGGLLAEIQASGVCKALGMRSLLDRWKIPFDELIAFGDDANDVEIIRESGLGVAMANSVPELLAVADFVTKSNDDDGIALVLEELLSY